MPNQYPDRRSNNLQHRSDAQEAAEMERLRSEVIADRKEKTAELRALEARLQRLEAARADSINIISLIKTKHDFAAIFIGKMYEIPGYVGINLPEGSWGGRSAETFATTHNVLATKITDAAHTSIGTLHAYQKQLSTSQLKMHQAVTAINNAIREVNANILATRNDINLLTSRLIRLPANAA